jgi:hypothetical protein
MALGSLKDLIGSSFFSISKESEGLAAVIFISTTNESEVSAVERESLSQFKTLLSLISFNPLGLK